MREGVRPDEGVPLSDNDFEFDAGFDYSSYMILEHSQLGRFKQPEARYLFHLVPPSRLPEHPRTRRSLRPRTQNRVGIRDGRIAGPSGPPDTCSPASGLGGDARGWNLGHSVLLLCCWSGGATEKGGNAVGSERHRDLDDGVAGASVLENDLGEIVRRVVEAAQPERIVLFGSAARGDPSEHDSDVDLLVVKEGAHRRKLAGDIYENLAGVGRAVDVVVVTPEDVERFGSSPSLVIEPAMREGRVIYDASS